MQRDAGRRQPLPQPQAEHRLPFPHVHWFRWVGEDPFGTGSVYACRCGAARTGF